MERTPNSNRANAARFQHNRRDVDAPRPVDSRPGLRLNPAAPAFTNNPAVARMQQQSLQAGAGSNPDDFSLYEGPHGELLPERQHANPARRLQPSGPRAPIAQMYPGARTSHFPTGFQPNLSQAVPGDVLMRDVPFPGASHNLPVNDQQNFSWYRMPDGRGAPDPRLPTLAPVQRNLGSWPISPQPDLEYMHRTPVATQGISDNRPVGFPPNMEYARRTPAPRNGPGFNPTAATFVPISPHSPLGIPGDPMAVDAPVALGAGQMPPVGAHPLDGPLPLWNVAGTRFNTDTYNFAEWNPHISAQAIQRNPDIVQTLISIEVQKWDLQVVRDEVELRVRDDMTRALQTPGADFAAVRAASIRAYEEAHQICQAQLAPLLEREQVLRNVLDRS